MKYTPNASKSIFMNKGVVFGNDIELQYTTLNTNRKLQGDGGK